MIETFTSWRYPKTLLSNRISIENVTVNRKLIYQQNIFHKLFRLKKCYKIINDHLEFCYTLPDNAKVMVDVVVREPMIKFRRNK